MDRQTRDGSTEARSSTESYSQGYDSDGCEDAINNIGFGKYQVQLLLLCGLGWLSDNATLQCVALMIPRIQIHFDLTPTGVSALSALTMAGMMLGSIFWGGVSDSFGRVYPYHATLLLTGIFNLGASYSRSFLELCICMFAVGTAVGGSMPTDGTLFLEWLPLKKQYLLTLLSVFFSLGAVLSSVLAILVLPSTSCPSVSSCDIAQGENDGWRQMLLILALLDFAMFVARSLLFRLHESPRYLSSLGLHGDRDRILSLVVAINGRTDRSEQLHMYEALRDNLLPGVENQESVAPQPELPALERLSSSLPILHRHPRTAVHGSPAYGNPSRITDVGNTATLDPEEPTADCSFTTRNMNRSNGSDEDLIRAGTDLNSESYLDRNTGSRTALQIQLKDRSLSQWSDRFKILFGPYWRRTTLLMWCIWTSMALAYGMFNVWLPTVLEERSKSAGNTLYDALLEYVWYSVAGTPGSLIGAYAIETKLGRRKSLAISTAATGLTTLLFTQTTTQTGQTIASCLLGNAATTMYAVLYGMTPEIFTTSLRGSAVGFLAATSRISGILAPALAGVLLSTDASLPLMASSVIFTFTTICSVFLPFEKALR